MTFDCDWCLESWMVDHGFEKNVNMNLWKAPFTNDGWVSIREWQRLFLGKGRQDECRGV